MSLLNKLVYKLSGGYFNPSGITDVSSAGIITNRDMYQTHRGVARIYVVERMPFKKVRPLLSSINENLLEIRKDIFMKVFMDVSAVTPQVNNPVYIAKMNKTLDTYTVRRDAYEAQSKELQTSGVNVNQGVRMFRYGRKHLAMDEHKYKSYTDVHNHVRDNDGVFFHVNLLIHVVFPDRISMDANESRVEKAIDREVEALTRVDKHIARTMLNFLPSISGMSTIDVVPILMSEQNLTHILPYDNEGILSDKGILIGMNVLNNTPMFIDVFGSPAGSSTLIAAKSGRGKSSMAYYYTTQLVANNVTVVYIDLKGSEVTEVLSKVVSNIYTIDFGHNHSTFVNTMRISKNVPDYTFADAISITSQMLSIFVALQPNEGNYQDLLTILAEAIKSYYNELGVFENNPDTYEKSSGMNYLELMTYIGIQRNQGGKEHLDILFAVTQMRLPEAIITFGMNNNENSVDLDELFRYSVIVFSLNKNQETTLTLVDQVRIFMAMMVSKRVAKFNKKNGTFTTVMAEEAQRYSGLPILMDGVSNLASGSRSDNMNVCVITNDLSILGSEHFSGFRANIANYLIGDCEGDTVGTIENVFKKPSLAKSVEEIILNPKQYAYTFSVYFDNGLEQTLCKVRCNASPRLLEAFKTRDVVVEGVT